MTPTRAHHARTAAAVVPLILVNGISIIAQYAYWHSHLASWPAPAAAGFATALESIAVFVGVHAHLAALSNDSATRLRLASYGLGAIIGGLNGSHYLIKGHVTAAAIGVGLLSASSPWLWSIHSRRQSRDELMAKGLIEPHALRIGTTRFLYHPVRSWRVMRAAAWTGTTDIAEAIAAVEPQAQSARVALDYQPEQLSDMTTLADSIRWALTELARSRNIDIAALSAREVADWLQERSGELADPSWTITPSYVSDVIRRTVLARERANSKVTQLPQGPRHAAISG